MKNASYSVSISSSKSDCSELYSSQSSDLIYHTMNLSFRINEFKNRLSKTIRIRDDILSLRGMTVLPLEIPGISTINSEIKFLLGVINQANSHRRILGCSDDLILRFGGLFVSIFKMAQVKIDKSNSICNGFSNPGSSCKSIRFTMSCLAIIRRFEVELHLIMMLHLNRICAYNNSCAIYKGSIDGNNHINGPNNNHRGVISQYFLFRKEIDSSISFLFCFIFDFYPCHWGSVLPICGVIWTRLSLLASKRYPYNFNSYSRGLLTSYAIKIGWDYYKPLLINFYTFTR